MTISWSPGTPTASNVISDIVEVTDGTRIIRARYRSGDLTGPADAWIDQNGKALNWRPTHWRTVPQRSPEVLVEAG